MYEAFFSSVSGRRKIRAVFEGPIYKAQIKVHDETWASNEATTSINPLILLGDLALPPRSSIYLLLPKTIFLVICVSCPWHCSIANSELQDTRHHVVIHEKHGGTRGGAGCERQMRRLHDTRYCHVTPHEFRYVDVW